MVVPSKGLRHFLVPVARRAFLCLPSARGQVAASTAGAEREGPEGTQNGYSRSTVVAAAALGALGGIVASNKDSQLRKLVLPGSFRACCDQTLTETQKQLAENLGKIVGSKNVSSNVTMKGSRMGKGTAMVVVKPGSIAEAIEVLKACAVAGVAVLPQGANTSLTGGSVPRDDQSDRPNVVINMRRLNRILPVGPDGNKVLCFAGAGIFDLQEKLKNEFSRDSHSVLGSIFLNPSVAAGISYGSGGTQIRKGPAYTDRALFLKVDKNGEVELVDTLGLKAKGSDAVKFLESAEKLEASDLDPSCKAAASWPEYNKVVTNLDAQVSRYNADTTGLDCNRSEGKLMILATLHDTFPMPKKSRLAWVSCKDLATAHALKREVALSSPDCMAKTCEYMNRDTVDAVDKAGRILVKMIELVGMKNLEPLWNLKLMVESVPLPFTGIICDKFLWWFNNILPASLPKPLQQMCLDFDHHLLMELAEYSDGELQVLEHKLEQFCAKQPSGSLKVHFCDSAFDRTRATLFRFSVAPAFRTYCIGVGQQGLSIDYALPKNFVEYPALPEKEYPIGKRLVYSHFGCNVYHEDFVFGPEVDVEKAKKAYKKAVEGTGGKLPAEHGHGTEYPAPPDKQKQWMDIDPTNTMNPGVGGTSFKKGYAPCDCAHH